MTWRTVILTKECKLSLRMNQLVVTQEAVTTIPLDEIATVIIENPSIVVTGHLLNALSRAKIHILLCNDKHLPETIVQSVYGNYHQAKNITLQIQWSDVRKSILWQKIIMHKLQNQSALLKHLKLEGAVELERLSREVQQADVTNREGHGAKVYFNRLFGMSFTRSDDDEKNARLNYGYALLHSLCARLIVSKGYLTELGVFHKNEFNAYNFASDLIEVFRPIVDEYVWHMKEEYFSKEDRRQLISLTEQKIEIRQKQYYLTQCVQLYLDGCLHYLNTGDEKRLFFPKLQFRKGL